MLDRILNRTKILEKAVDATWLRNEVISQNVANIDTPGYKRKTVKFEEYLNDAMDLKGRRTDEKHIPIGPLNIDQVEANIMDDGSSLSYRLDGNNVDIENEMALLSKNSIQYNTLIEKLSGSFKSIKSVIREGK